MTRSIMPEEMVQAFKPDYVAPIVLLMCSDKMPQPATGRLFESGSGWAAETRWQRSGGALFQADGSMTPEAVKEQWNSIVNFDDGRADHPQTAQDAQDKIMANLNKASNKGKPAGKDNKKYLALIEKAKKAQADGTEFAYDERDVILYSKARLRRVRASLTFYRPRNRRQAD